VSSATASALQHGARQPIPSSCGTIAIARLPPAIVAAPYSPWSTGAMLPFQFGINSVLARYVDGAARASLVSFVVGTLSLLVAVLVFFRGVPSGEKLASAPWWVWVGGVLGAFYVLGSVVTAPKLGAVTLVALILAGQAAPEARNGAGRPK